MRKKLVTTLVCAMFITMSVTLASSTIADWVPADGHKMHYPQMPDVTYSGVAVQMPPWINRADDFRCSESGWITDIHIWGSFKGDSLPAMGPDGVIFILSIWSNIPAYPYPGYDFSRPGRMLWQKVFYYYQYDVTLVADNIKEAWYYPETGAYTPDDHDQLYQYNFEIPISQAFFQQNGTTYWLGVKTYSPMSPNQAFGWKSTRPYMQWNDNAVRWTTTGWSPLSYPADHPTNAGDPLDFAFVIDGFPPLVFVPLPMPRFTPATLPIQSKGNWIMATIEPPEGYEAEDIVLDTVLLDDTIPVDWGKITGENVMLKFDRGELEDLLLSGPLVRPAEFKITGRLADGTFFVGYSGPVNVINPPDFP